MSNIDKQALYVPEREKHDWGQAEMRDCDFCQQWALTVKHSDGGCICASCCDAEYTSDLKVNLVTALERLEAAKQDASKWFKAFEKAVSVGARYEEQIAELEAREVVLPQPAQWDISEVLLDKAKVLKAIRDAGITVKGE
ncbi:hypothetical protein DEO48_09465 [Enterobacter sp. CGMCC 5087]|uniref:hypothetical protein n=1 Tax=Enterobacter sp. CGMCC 5087 TaxID=2183878 RepID=UPI000D6724A4|nr:hypothetical protein [Enterobacter sp. CGMCC 5087]PWI80314.1 hypothetical protein DEO48_09465 [Enterobacter sp. CGMCC 5087]